MSGILNELSSEHERQQNTKKILKYFSKDERKKRMLYNTKMGFESFILSKSNNYKMLCLKKRPVCVSSYFMKYFGSRQIVVFISSSYNIYRKLSCNSIN